MLTGKSDTWADGVLDYLLGGANPTRPTSRKLSLHSVAPAADAVGTEIAGTGYSPGGVTLAFAAASAGSAAAPPSGVIQLTNGSGGTWAIDGALIHAAPSGAPDPTDIIYFLDLEGALINVPDGIVLEITSVTATES